MKIYNPLKKTRANTEKIIMYKLTLILALSIVFGCNQNTKVNKLSPAVVTDQVKNNDDTAVLWLLDESTYPHTTLTDASVAAKADLCLMNGGILVKGKYGNALKVNGSDFAVCFAGFAGKVPQEEMRGADGVPSGLWGPTEGPDMLLNALAGDKWTVELWLNLSKMSENSSILDLGQAYDPGLSIKINPKGLVLSNHYAGVNINCRLTISLGNWHHIAFSRDRESIALFLDGIKQKETEISTIAVKPLPNLQIPEDREHESRGFENMSIEQRRMNRFNISIGTDRHANNGMQGMVDEIRISKGGRYSSNFTLESFSRNYGMDTPDPAKANGPALLFDPDPVSIPLDFGLRKYVFIDDAILETQSNVQLSMNQPGNKQPLDLDFEIKKSAWRPSVFEINESQIYMAIPESYSSNEGLTYLAKSEDGLTFNMAGNIIPETPMYGAFFKDLNPDIPDAQRYKVNAFVANRGMYFYTSPDGLNWRRNETIQLPLVSGGGGECFWDDQRGVYIGLIKRDSSFRTKKFPGKGPKGHKAVMFETNEILKPWPFRAIEAPWYEGWPFPSVTGEGQTLFTAQEYGWVYRTRAIKYPWAPDVYLAFIWRYPGDDGARHVELAVSRNGRKWKLFGTNWYLPTGAADEELMMYGLIRRGDEIWQYANEGGAHGGSAPRFWSRYTQRLDGFVSLDAGKTSGKATTLPLIFQGNRLVLNINVAGYAKIAITDENGNPFSGFGLDDCDLIKIDSVRHTVTWKGRANIGHLSGKIIRLKFEFQNSKLYAFQLLN
jgi:hypothetical protein